MCGGGANDELWVVVVMVAVLGVVMVCVELIPK